MKDEQIDIPDSNFTFELTWKEKLALGRTIILSKLPFFITIGLIYFIYLMYLATFIFPNISDPKVAVLLVVSLILFVLINWAYLRASFTDPGEIGREDEWDLREIKLKEWVLEANDDRSNRIRQLNIKRRWSEFRLDS